MASTSKAGRPANRDKNRPETKNRRDRFALSSKALDDPAKIATVARVHRPSLVALTLAMSLLVAASHAQSAPASSAKTNPDSSAVGYSIRGGLEIATRHFAYSDPLVIATNLRPYDVTGVPLFALGGDIRPFVWTDVPVLKHASLSFDYAFAPALVSSTDASDDIKTSWDHGDLTLRVPVRLGKHLRAPTITPTLGYGWLGFSFVNTGPLAAEIPTVTYRFVRAGITGEITLTKPLTLIASFDYLAPLEGGSVYERFRDPTVDGIGAKLGCGINIAQNTRLTLMFDYTRFFSSFVPVPGDAFVAGGALDQFGTVKAGIEYGN